MQSTFSTHQKSKWISLSIYVLAAIVACGLKIMLDFRPHGGDYISKVNNFFIFRNSFFHLLDHISLYQAYPAEQYDLYKYSPSFALLFAPLAILPPYVGVMLWSVLNAWLLWFAVSKLRLGIKQQNIVYGIMLIELITSIQNVQVNPIIAALFILTFVSLENDQPVWAAFCVVLSAYIKVYGVLAAVLFICYDKPIRFILYCFVWGITIGIAPLIILSPQELLYQYQDWLNLIANDHQTRAVDVSIMRFVMGISNQGFNNQLRLTIQILGVLLFLLKYLKWGHLHDAKFRFLTLCSVMIWSIVFNHLAESATYIIAVAGVAIWYAYTTPTKLDHALLLLMVVLTLLSPTDIFPRSIRESIIVPYGLKAIPCFLIWLRIEWMIVARSAIVNHEASHAD